MKIAIIGTGNVGAALTRGWARAGHDILLGVRKENLRAKALAEETGATIVDVPAAIAEAEVIVLAVPSPAIPDLAPLLKGAEDKVVIDPTNAFRAKPEGFETGYEALRALTPCRHLMKAFNNTGAPNMLDPLYPSGPIDTFVAGDSPSGKETVRQLALDLGFGACHDFGGSAQAPLLEQLALAWINLALVQGMGRDIALTLVSRDPANKG